MEEKERYELVEILPYYLGIRDNKEWIIYSETEQDCDLLNQQDQRIKELENMNSRLSQGIYWGNGEHFCDVVSKLKKENQQLKQQLHDLPKKIVREIRNNIQTPFQELVDEVGTTIDISKQRLFNVLDTILKKYGGENEKRKS